MADNDSRNQTWHGCSIQFEHWDGEKWLKVGSEDKQPPVDAVLASCGLAWAVKEAPAPKS